MTLPERVDATISADYNCTETELIDGGEFTGRGEQSGHAHFGVSLKTDQSGILYTEFSGNGRDWDSVFPPTGFNVAAGVHEFHTGVKLGRYFRVRFENNSGSDQTYLRLYTYFGNHFVPSNAPLNQSIGLDSDATATRITDFTDEVLIGRRGGITHFSKFGYRDDLLAASGEQTIWSSTGNFTPMTVASTFTIAYNATTDGLGTTGALTLYIQYIDADGLAAATVHTLGDTGTDVTSFTGLGINRIAVSSNGGATWNTNAISVTSTGAGTIQAGLPALGSVTQQAIFHVDANSDGVAKDIWLNVNKISGGGSPRVSIKGYVYNRLINTRFEVFRTVIDTGVENTVIVEPPIGFKLSPADVLYFTADTDTNATVAAIRFSLLEYKRN